MSLQASLIRLAIRLVPEPLIALIANVLLRGILRLNRFHFSLEPRQLDLAVRLEGEPEDILLVVENFGIQEARGQLSFVIHSAKTNKVWLKNLLSHILQKPWPIPDVPALAPVRPLFTELLWLPEVSQRGTPSVPQRDVLPKSDKPSSGVGQKGTP